MTALAASLNALYCLFFWRLCRVLLATPNWCKAQSQPEGIDKVVDARFSFDVDADGILVPVTFNGHCANFLLDTGCTRTTFDVSFRNELGPAVRTVSVHTGEGRTERSELLKLPRATLGNIPLTGVSEVICIDLSRIRAVFGNEIYGILGMDFLFGRVVQIDFDRGEVVFLRSVPGDSGAPILLGLSPMGPTVAITITGVGRRSFQIDTGHSTGASGALEERLMQQMLATGQAVKVANRVSISALGERDTQCVRLGKIALGEFSHTALHFLEADASAIGLRYLSRYVVTFDFPRMRMHLKPGRRFSEPDRYSVSGLSILRPAGVTTVSSVEKASPAESVGVIAGDVIEQFDGKAAASLSLLQIRRALCDPGKHTLRISRDKKTLDIALFLKAPDEPTQDSRAPKHPPVRAEP